MPDRPTFKWEWNINTIAVLVGIFGGFVAWGYTLAEMRGGQQINAGRILELQTAQAGLAARVDLIERGDVKQEQVEYRLAQAEKALEAVDQRIGRITEAYSNQFSEMRNQLSVISTQIALTNQSLNRIEAASSVANNKQPD